MEQSKTVPGFTKTQCHLTLRTHPAGPVDMILGRTELAGLSHLDVLWHMERSGILTGLDCWHDCALTPLRQRDISSAKRIPSDPHGGLFEAPQSK